MCLFTHVVIVSSRAVAAECASVGERRSKVVVSFRCTRQSWTYCSYVTAHGPRFLSASGKRRFLLERRSWSIFVWNGSRLGCEVRLRNSEETRHENLLNRASTHGGISFSGGFHFDGT